MVALDGREDAVPALGVEAGRRLVQHQDAGLHRHDAGHRHPALLAARQLEGAAVQQGLVQAHEAGGLPHPAVDLLFLQAHVFGAEGDVLIAGLLEQLVLGVLEHQPRQKAEVPYFGGVLPDVPAVDDDAASGGLVQAVHVADQGALARAGGPDDAHEIPFFHLEADVVQSGHFAGHPGVIHIGKMFYLDDACHTALPHFSSS